LSEVLKTLIIQKYDFDIRHAPGRDKVAADAFSRLIPLDCSSSIIPQMIYYSQFMN